MKVHFMGIGGSGASAVARLAKAQGYEVSGCDLENSGIINNLQKEGIDVKIGHDVSHLKNIDILAHSPAIYYQSQTEKEFTKAKNPMIWEEFMAKYLMKNKFVVAVAGTHGKGTTTSMLCWILEQAGLDPTCEIGANMLAWGKKNDRIGKSKLFICEADEYREKFLLYKPDILLITSIEMDHPDYFKDYEAVVTAFVKIAAKSKKVVVNGEDGGCLKLKKTLKYKSFKKGQMKLRFPGKHIRSDAAGAAAVAKILGVKNKVIKEALESYTGLERRFELRGEVNGMKLIDDYAHHPTAVEVNIAGARERYPKARIVAVFQPHMYARLAAMFDEFKKVLSKADKVAVLDVYSKREPGISKPTGKDLALAIGGPKATYIGGDLNNVANFLLRNGRRGDVVLLMGAGDIYKVSDQMMLTSGSKSIS
ncbi:MAG: cyanophycin synthetase [Patescibacteria group bacterium]